MSFAATKAASATAAGASDAAYALQMALIAKRDPNGRHAFLVCQVAGGILVAPRTRCSADWNVLQSELQTLTPSPQNAAFGRGIVHLLGVSAADGTTDFPLFGAPDGVSLVGTTLVTHSGVRVYALCDGRARAPCRPSDLGMDEQTHGELQRASMHMLQLQDANTA